jgi:tRNA dimethylallyltransferase
MIPPILIAGPTAAGKSEIALLLAEQLGGEIISSDSMQVYRGLDLGTAKPAAAERARVPHHLIDICDLAESFDAARFATLAKQAVAEIQARGRTPILCGGTGLYFKAFLEGVGAAPPADPVLRGALERLPLETLLAELRERDPVTFDRIDRQNPRRVIRAVEVIRLTGKPFSDQRAAWNSPGGGPSGPNPLFIGLLRSNSDLQTRINARVEGMFRAGLVAETEQLLTRGLAQNPTALQAIGYRQVVEYLGRESRSPAALAETIELVKIRTRQFAKRQRAWFRRHGNPVWIELKPAEPPGLVAERLVRQFRGGWPASICGKNSCCDKFCQSGIMA